MGQSQGDNKIWFIQLTRAIACLIVVYVHWITFTDAPNEVLKLIELVPLDNYPKLPVLSTYSSAMTHVLPFFFREAHFALGFFFLISGFIIPYSIGKSSPFEFLFRRIMRVYPTVIVCVLITALMIMLARVVANLPVEIYSFDKIAANMLLITNHLHSHMPYIEHGLWTLEIEVRFYLLCFVLAFFNGYRKASVLIFIPLIIAILSGKIYATYISLTLIGTCLFNWNEGTWNGKKTIFMILIFLMINKYYLGRHFRDPELAMSVYANHVYVVLTFILLYLVNNKLPYSALMNKIADVSYSLYLVHGCSGYAVYFICFYLFHSLALAVLATTTWILVLTLLIHKYVEIPSIKIPKQIVKYFKTRKSLPKFESQESEA